MKARKNYHSIKASEENFSGPKKALMVLGDESKEKLPFRTDISRRFSDLPREIGSNLEVKTQKIERKL